MRGVHPGGGTWEEEAKDKILFIENGERKGLIESLPPTEYIDILARGCGAE